MCRHDELMNPLYQTIYQIWWLLARVATEAPTSKCTSASGVGRLSLVTSLLCYSAHAIHAGSVHQLPCNHSRFIQILVKRNISCLLSPGDCFVSPFRTSVREFHDIDCTCQMVVLVSTGRDRPSQVSHWLTMIIKFEKLNHPVFYFKLFGFDSFQNKNMT
jgi:hypothetical protein